jgi:hypothetical protein
MDKIKPEIDTITLLTQDMPSLNFNGEPSPQDRGPLLGALQPHGVNKF